MQKFLGNQFPLILVLVSAIMVAAPYPCYADSAFQELLERVANQLGTDVETARNFIVEVDGMARAIQRNFEQIASDETDYSEKLRLKRITITQFFSSPSATIQISSLNRKRITEKGIDRYLTDLAGLYKRYHTVKLKFDENYFKLGNIQHFYEGRRQRKKYFEFTVDMWQQFIGCYDDARRRCYKDWTKKGFQMIFKDEGRWTYRVKAVTVEDTVSFEEYDQKRR
jgi:hypothetical protein